MGSLATQETHIHFVGIGGCGMSGIADVLFSKGHTITGSDVKENKTIQYLRNKGIQVYIGHAEHHIKGANLVVRSSAIDETNPELVAARQQRIPIFARAEMLAKIMDKQKGIAISGTHGKTTTTSLVTAIFLQAKKDPTYLIGGTLHQSGVNAKFGLGEFCIAEADESDASFLFLNPEIAIITNIDADHLWFYHDDFNRLKQTFIDFLHRLPDEGLAVLCHDDETNVSILPSIQRPYVTYGFHKNADVQVLNYSQFNLQSRFQIKFTKTQKVIDIVLNLPGKHNALNATAAFIVAQHAGIQERAIKTAYTKFSGVGRRFQIRGDYQINGVSALVIDDYGHHPREIAATLDAARSAWPNRRIVLAFQPHRYTRTKDLFNEFVEVLAKPDQLILLDVYPAGEQPIKGIDGLSLSNAIHNKATNQVMFLNRQTSLQTVLPSVLKENDILILQGAGDIAAIAVALVP